VRSKTMSQVSIDEVILLLALGVLSCVPFVLYGATLPRDGATPFEPGREGRGLLRRWRRMATATACDEGQIGL
jgi:hypothetical protein